MENKSINDFDKAIEQAMNKYAEAPPYGMWNRISTELGNPTSPVVAPKPNSVFTKGSVYGFLSGALLIGGLVISNMIYNSNSEVSETTSENKMTTVSSFAAVNSQKGELEENFSEPALVSEMEAKFVQTAHRPIAVFEAKIEKANPLPVSLAEQTTAELTKPTVPEKTLYFPPVDIETGNSVKGGDAVLGKSLSLLNHTTIYSEEQKAEEKVAKYKEQRLKFKPKKKRTHSYGTINRRSVKNK